MLSPHSYLRCVVKDSRSVSLSLDPRITPSDPPLPPVTPPYHPLLPTSLTTDPDPSPTQINAQVANEAAPEAPVAPTGIVPPAVAAPPEAEEGQPMELDDPSTDPLPVTMQPVAEPLIVAAETDPPLAAADLKVEGPPATSIAAESSLPLPEPTAEGATPVEITPAVKEESLEAAAVEAVELPLGPTAELLESSCGWDVKGKVEVSFW